jgi:hypothetical protein
MRSPFGVAEVMVSEFKSEFGWWNQTTCHLCRHRRHRVLVLGFKFASMLYRLVPATHQVNVVSRHTILLSAPCITPCATLGR